jgi:hypothetical protein
MWLGVRVFFSRMCTERSRSRSRIWLTRPHIAIAELAVRQQCGDTLKVGFA